VNKIAITAFSDELEKISSMQLNIGTRIVSRAGAAAKGAGNVLHETGQAVLDHLNPVQKMRESWNASKWWGMKGLTVGGAALAAPEVLPKEDPLHMNRGRAERLIGNVAGTASGLITMQRGFVPALATGLAAQYAGGRVGRMIDKAKGRKAPATPTPPAQAPVAAPPARTP
jgi:hypothetical protein